MDLFTAEYPRAKEPTPFDLGVLKRARTQSHPQKDEMVELYRQGKSTKEIAKILGCGRNTVSKWVKRSGVGIRERDEALALSESWKERKDGRYRSGCLTDVEKMARRKLKGSARARDLPLWNSPHIKAERRESARVAFGQKYYSDAKFRVIHILRSRLRKVIDRPGKRHSILDVIGCSRSYLISWLEGGFDDGMSWENQGEGWHIDHVVPLSAVDVENESIAKIAWNWRNLRPLWSRDNISKGDRVTPRELDYLQSTPDGEIKDKLISLCASLIRW